MLIFPSDGADTLFQKSIIMFITFGDNLIDEQIFFLPQVKSTIIISNKHGIYELPHEFAKQLKT